MKVNLRNVAYLGAPRGSSALTLNTAATGLIAWYDASQITGLNNNDAVASWTDVSSVGTHTVTQATPGNRPTYLTNQAGGKPCVRFVSASAQRLSTSDTGFPTGDSTMVIVLRSNTDYPNGVYGYPIAWCASGTNQSIWFYIAGTTSFGGNCLFGATQNGDAGPSWGFAATCYNAFHVLVCTKTGTSWKFYRDNVTSANKTFTTSSTLGGTFYLGTRPPVAESFNGDICEAGVYNRVVSASELSNIIRLLGTKYSITVSP